MWYRGVCEKSGETLTVNTGALLTMSVSVNGGTPPYKYAWKKDGQPVEGQTTDTFSKANTQSGDKGAYTCEGNGFCRTSRRALPLMRVQ